MNAIVILGLVLLIIIIWLSVDYALGYKKHVHRPGLKCYPRYNGKLTLFTDGRDLYERYFSDLQQAQYSLKIQFYIVKNDAISHEFLSIIGEKAAQGIKVRLLMDWFGSMKVKKQDIEKLKKAGVEVAFAHKPRLPFIFFTLQTRNHRRITVIDGKTGYIGGFNIGKEYIGNDPKFGYWRDYHLKVEGKSVEDMLDQFNQDWQLSTGEKLKPYVQQEVFEEHRIEHQFVCTKGKELDKLFIGLVKDAEKEIVVCTPYFIPDQKLLDELLSALKKGITVKIIVPMKSDHLLVREAAFPYFGKLLLHGCQIYRFYQGFYHAKVVIVDDKVCDLGTGNFDKRSFYLNDEINCFIYDSSFISKVKENIHQDIDRSEQLTYESYQKRPVFQRGKEMVATMMSRFL